MQQETTTDGPALLGARLPFLLSSDWVGIAASVACAIHCAAMPLIIASLPMLDLGYFDAVFHQWMAVVCSVIALVAFLPGWRKHRRLGPPLIATLGLSVIVGAAFGLTGSCCAPAADASGAGGGATSCCPSAAAVAASGAAESTDSCCPADEGTTTAAISVAAFAVVPNPTAGLAAHASAPWYAAYLTPLGGLLLIAGHLLNHHYSCRCIRCTAD
ncbi:MAG: MerC domain-containing protein [Planctomycetota bacterium]|nr:MAG: MerC domain-containing protein [Planctomycetota bacterium]REJ90356.1 MAG: MerC domain-containing protein [Planctomycetota bacterium]